MSVLMDLLALLMCDCQEVLIIHTAILAEVFNNNKESEYSIFLTRQQVIEIKKLVCMRDCLFESLLKLGYI